MTNTTRGYNIDNAIANYVDSSRFGMAPLYYMAKYGLVNAEYDSTNGCAYSARGRKLKLCPSCSEKFAKYIPITPEQFVNRVNSVVQNAMDLDDVYNTNSHPMSSFEDWLFTAKQVSTADEVEDQLGQILRFYTMRVEMHDSKGTTPYMWSFDFVNILNTVDSHILPFLLLQSYELVPMIFWGSLVATILSGGLDHE